MEQKTPPKIKTWIKTDKLIISAASLNSDNINHSLKILYTFINNYENNFFVKIQDIPYCLMPDALEHLDYKKNHGIKYHRLLQCSSCKYSDSCHGLSTALTPLGKKIKPVADLPLDIAIELNSECNLNCKFCTKRKDKTQVELPFKKIKQVLNEASALNIKYIRFTGGEPLLRNDLIKILSRAKEMGFYVFLNTNSTLLNRDIISKIEKYTDNILVSICGYDLASEKKISQNASFLKKKWENILRLKSSKIPYLRIGTVISKLLINHFDRYSELLNILQVKNWELYRPMQDISRNVNFNLNKNDFLKLLPKIMNLRKSGMNVYIANPLPFCITDIATLRPIMHGSRFEDGHCRLVLSTKGYFKPSYFINYNLGRNITDSWNHPFIKKINSLSYLPCKCQRCFYLNWCLGGSRYMANSKTKNYFATDPLMKNNGNE